MSPVGTICPYFEDMLDPAPYCTDGKTVPGRTLSGTAMIDHHSTETLERLLDRLDVKSRNAFRVNSRHAFGSEAMRANPRYRYRVECRIFRFHEEKTHVIGTEGRTRNLSRNGLGLITANYLETGIPVEVRIHPPDKPDMYFAGIVAYCRHAGLHFHEIGISLRVVSEQPVFSKDPRGALERDGWIRDALGLNRKNQAEAGTNET